MWDLALALGCEAIRDSSGGLGDCLGGVSKWEVWAPCVFCFLCLFCGVRVSFPPVLAVLWAGFFGLELRDFCADFCCCVLLLLLFGGPFLVGVDAGVMVCVGVGFRRLPLEIAAESSSDSSGVSLPENSSEDP